MTVSFATFDRLKAKGVEAYKNGDYLAAKTYLVDAAGCTRIRLGYSHGGRSKD